MSGRRLLPTSATARSSRKSSPRGASAVIRSRAYRRQGPGQRREVLDPEVVRARGDRAIRPSFRVKRASRLVGRQGKPGPRQLEISPPRSRLSSVALQSDVAGDARNNWPEPQAADPRVRLQAQAGDVAAPAPRRDADRTVTLRRHAEAVRQHRRPRLQVGSRASMRARQSTAALSASLPLASASTSMKDRGDRQFHTPTSVMKSPLRTTSRSAPVNWKRPCGAQVEDIEHRVGDGKAAAREAIERHRLVRGIGLLQRRLTDETNAPVGRDHEIEPRRRRVPRDFRTAVPDRARIESSPAPLPLRPAARRPSPAGPRAAEHDLGPVAPIGRRWNRT